MSTETLFIPYATNEDVYQPAHLGRLTRAFDFHCLDNMIVAIFTIPRLLLTSVSEVVVVVVWFNVPFNGYGHGETVS